MLIGWASNDPAAALDRLDLAPAGGLALAEGQIQQIGGLETSERVLKAAADTDLDATVNWLLDNPDKMDERHLYSNIGRALEKRFFADVTGTLNMIRDHAASGILKQGLNYILSNNGKGYVEDVWKWVRDEPPSEVTTAIKRAQSLPVSPHKIWTGR